jgi:ubiquinone/menaquinone biosynthesis C-methylase UbiE/acetyltransferase-like isoleucine patch superfamily enzyme
MSLYPASDSTWVSLHDASLGGWFNRAAGELASGFPVGADDVVLDAGCGPGGYAAFCAEFGASLILADVNADKVGAARARLAAYPQVKFETHVADASDLPVPDEVATRIVCSEVLEHVDDPTAVMAELVRVGKPGALYLLTVPGIAQEQLQQKLARPEYFAKPEHIRIFHPDIFAALVRDAGLTIERTGEYGFFNSLWMAFFWQTDIPISELASALPRHPSLEQWARTWNLVLSGKDGPRIKAALDAVLPKSQLIIARKPGGSIDRERDVRDRMHATPAREAPAGGNGEKDGESEAFSSRQVGDRDDQLSGWYNRSTGELFHHYPVDAHDVVLDVGCGDGGHAAFCAERGARLILVDVDADKVKAARARLSAYPGLRLDTHVVDGSQLPLADGTANRIVCCEVLEHVDDPAAVLGEIARAGRPGALYLITVPGAAQEQVQKSLAAPDYFVKPNHVRVIDARAAARLVQEAGLTIEHTVDYGFFWSIWMAFWWQCDVPLFGDPHHPCLAAWAKTWDQVLAGKDGARIKAALDAVLPKSHVIVARKPRPFIARRAQDTLYECTRHLADGEKCGEDVLEKLAAEIEGRLAHADLMQRPARPRLSGLRIRREGLPDWWGEGKNLFLAAQNVTTPAMDRNFFVHGPARGGVLVMGDRASVAHVTLLAERPLMVIGDRVEFGSVALGTVGYGTVLIGEESRATAFAGMDARNGGVISVGADAMWAPGVFLMVDDTHAIRNAVTGKRVNRRGGKIIIGPHVWLGMNVQIMGDSYIGEDSVVGMGSLVKNIVLPPNTVSSGRPARVTRSGITWSSLDLP